MNKYELFQTILGLLGLISIILLYWQIRSSLEWNKIQFSINRLDKALLREYVKEIRNIGINLDEKTLSDDEYKIIMNEKNVKILYKIQSLLDMFENFSTLYNMNVLNNHFAYQAYSENTIFFYLKFKRIIKYCREQNSDIEYYINFEKCANKFIRKQITLV